MNLSKNTKDLTGQRFGRLTAVEPIDSVPGKGILWRCQCDCGGTKDVPSSMLVGKKTQSCGCLQASIISENLKLCEGTSITILEATKRRLLSSNQSGCTGVYLNKRTGKWTAQITFKRKSYYLGSYDKIEDAVKARRRGEELHDDFLNWYYQKQKQEQQTET